MIRLITQPAGGPAALTVVDTGRLEAIWIKRAHREPMDPVQLAQLDTLGGIVGNADYGSRRQVTVIAKEVWDRLPGRILANVEPTARRANLMVSGIHLENTAGRILRIGDCRIRIQGETKPCNRMDEAYPGLKDALLANWGGGVYGQVLDDGEIKVGTVVTWAE